MAIPLSGRSARLSVRSLVVIVPHVLVENSLKVTSTPDQHPVQALLPDCPHPALGDRACVRRLDGGGDDLGAVAGEDVIEARVNLLSGREQGTATRWPPLPLRFALDRELPRPLDHPGPIRVVGDASKPDPPRAQFDDNKT
jgi:hypothetical protein